MSPKAVSKVIRSPPQTRKPHPPEPISDTSQAISTNKRLKILIESDYSDIDSPISSSSSFTQKKRSKKLKISKHEKRSEKAEPEQLIEPPRISKSHTPTVTSEIEEVSPTTPPKHSTISEDPELHVIHVPWTREEDKYILEEQRKGYESESELVSRLKDGLTNRTTAEVNERFEFLMDLLKKIQEKTK